MAAGIAEITKDMKELSDEKVQLAEQVATSTFTVVLLNAIANNNTGTFTFTPNQGAFASANSIAACP